MSGILDPQDAMIPSRKLNDVNDPSPGQIVSTSQVSGSIIQPFYGQVGKRLCVTAQTAQKLQDTSIGYLYEGIYQYVQVDSGASSPARGQIAYWTDYTNFKVTNLPTPTSWAVGSQLQSGSGGIATGGALPIPIAGVFISAPTAGNYCYIQIQGRATVRFKTLITNANGGIFRTVVADGLTSATADILNAASPVLMNLAQLVLGITLNTPSDAGLGIVDLYNIRQVLGGYTGF